ncbi:MAG: iron ABC transporter permease [Blastomonas sp.]
MLRQTKTSRVLLLALPAMVALALALLSLLAGPASLSPQEILAAFTDNGDPVIRAILIELRLPRALLALMVGSALGLSGAVLQGYLRNPLADASVLGTANAGALGAIIAFYFGLYAAFPPALPLLAIGFALLGLLPLMLLARRSENPVSLILAGIAIGTLAGAGISLTLNLSPNPFAAMEIMSWLMGSLEDRSFDHVLIALPFLLPGMALMLWDGRRLDALILGEDSARAMGVDMARLRLRLVIGVALAVGAAVAVSGAIGFVGLVVPHLVRPFTDRSPSAILLPSALAGAALLVAADLAVRLIPATNELKLGVITAFLGTPVFLYHLIRARRIW